MGFDLSNYEDVATLNKWFQDNYPLGRIHVKMEWFSLADQEVIFRGEVYRDTNDTHPAVSNYARGKASEYPRGMQRWYIEDTATSVIGRCILLLKAADKTATKDSMKQVKSEKDMDQIWVKPQAEEKPIANEPETIVWDEPELKAFEDKGAFIQDLVEKLGAEPIGFACSHGERVYRTGVSSKNGKAWANYSCVAKGKEQCDPIWGKQANNGEFVFEPKAAQ